MNARPPNLAMVVRLMTADPHSHANDVEVAVTRDRERGDVLGVSVVGCDAGIEADHAHEVFGERDRDGAERGGANNGELPPTEQEGGKSSPAFAQERVEATGSRGLRWRVRQVSARRTAQRAPPRIQMPSSGSGPGMRSAMPAGDGRSRIRSWSR